MTLQDLITRCRIVAGDRAQPYLWDDPEWIDALNEAAAEACIRARLIEKEDVDLVQSANDPYAEIPDWVWSIRRVTFNGRRLILLDKAMLDECEGEDWEERTADAPVACYEVGGRLRFYPIPTTDGAVVAHAFCTPQAVMEEGDDEPTWLRTRLHEKLVDWALHVAYSKVDADTIDPSKAEKHEAAFERVFGPRPDEKAMRRLRINVTRRVSGTYF